MFPDPATNLAKRTNGRPNAAGIYAEWGWAWPGSVRILYNRASADPAETPYRNTLVTTARDPLTRFVSDAENPIANPGDPAYPLIATTYHLTEHFMHTRYDSWLAELQPGMFIEISPELATEVGVRSGDWVVVSSPRGELEVRALVTDRLRPLVVQGRLSHIVGLVNQFGYRGEVVGASANDLTAMILSAASEIDGAKSFVCRLRAGRRADVKQPVAEPTVTEPRLTEPIPETPWAAQPYGWQERPTSPGKKS